MARFNGKAHARTHSWEKMHGGRRHLSFYQLITRRPGVDDGRRCRGVHRICAGLNNPKSVWLRDGRWISAEGYPERVDRGDVHNYDLKWQNLLSFGLSTGC